MRARSRLVALASLVVVICGGRLLTRPPPRPPKPTEGFRFAILGDRTFAMRVWLNLERMRAYSVSSDDVMQAVREQRQIGILMQRDQAVEDPGPADLYRVGTVANLVRYVTAPDGNHRARHAHPGGRAARRARPGTLRAG